MVFVQRQRQAGGRVGGRRRAKEPSGACGILSLLSFVFQPLIHGRRLNDFCQCQRSHLISCQYILMFPNREHDNLLRFHAECRSLALSLSLSPLFPRCLNSSDTQKKPVTNYILHITISPAAATQHLFISGFHF